MSDMAKLLNIMEQSSMLAPGETVRIGNSHGGGVGQIVTYNPGANTIVIDVKGVQREMPCDSIEPALPNATATQGVPHNVDPLVAVEPRCRDHPEIMPGDRVRIDSMYGAGNGEGYGVFVANSLDGQTVIVNVDSQDLSIPVELVYAAPENQDKDNFNSTGGAGELSPVPQQPDTKDDSVMDDMKKLMTAMEDCGEPHEEAEEKGSEESCDCGNYDCTTCHPLTESELYDQLQGALDECIKTEDLVEYDLKGNEDDFDYEMDYEADPAAGDELVNQAMGAEPQPGDQEAAQAELQYQLGAENTQVDVSELIAKIEYIQDMGMSNSDTHYDIDKLTTMKPEQVQRIHDKVSDEMSETTSAGGIASVPGMGGKVQDEGGMYEDDIDEADRELSMSLADHLGQQPATSSRSETEARLAQITQEIEAAQAAGDYGHAEELYPEQEKLSWELDEQQATMADGPEDYLGGEKFVGEAEEKADCDYDGDGEIESAEDEYKGSKDKAIKADLDEAEVVSESADADVVRMLNEMKQFK